MAERDEKQDGISGRRLSGFLAAVAAIFIVGSLLPEDPAGDPVAAYVDCKRAVRDRLRAPATAEFPGYREERTTDLGEGVWRIHSHVDSENAFGAMLRSEWVCEVLTYGDRPSTIMSVDIRTR